MLCRGDMTLETVLRRRLSDKKTLDCCGVCKLAFFSPPLLSNEARARPRRPRADPLGPGWLRVIRGGMANNLLTHRTESSPPFPPPRFSPKNRIFHSVLRFFPRKEAAGWFLYLKRRAYVYGILFCFLETGAFVCVYTAYHFFLPFSKMPVLYSETRWEVFFSFGSGKFSWLIDWLIDWLIFSSIPFGLFFFFGSWTLCDEKSEREKQWGWMMSRLMHWTSRNAHAKLMNGDLQMSTRSA